MRQVLHRVFKLVEVDKIVSKFHPLRDHGFMDNPKPLSVPRATPLKPGDMMSKVGNGVVKCPNCDCLELMQIELEVENKRLKGGKGTGFYLGCPACPWASPMMTVTHGSTPGPSGSS